MILQGADATTAVQHQKYIWKPKYGTINSLPTNTFRKVDESDEMVVRVNVMRPKVIS